MFTVSALYIYPVKSLGGFGVTEAIVTERGFQYDRRWMLVDKEGRFITQREVHSMALLQTAIIPKGLYVYHKHNPGKNITIHFLSSPVSIKKVQVWDDVCNAWCYGDNEMNRWFTDVLGKECELVYMPDETNRLVDTAYAKNNEITSFSDGYPFLIIGQSSLNELNSKLSTPFLMDRFRPNIVFTNGSPYIEDNWKHFCINDIDFFGVKTCSRCVITTIDQQTMTAGKEPLKTLATYRAVNNKIKFGMNLLHRGKGKLKVGDQIIINSNSH